jgi:hypothetical protein
MEDKIVTLESFYDPMLAEIIRGRLEANGISCFVADNNTIGANPLYNNALGGVKLKVFERDIEKCREILAEPEDLTILEEPATEITASCPYCNSTNVRYGAATEVKATWFTTFLSFILFSYPVFHARKTWHCFNCYRDFE